MLKPIVVLAIGLAGWALGRSRPAINVAMLVMAVFAAVFAHSGMQFAFVEGRLHHVLGDPRADAPAVLVVAIAAGEAVGLWVPVLLVPWATIRARLWGALYALAASTAAAATFYFPFDGVDFNNEIISTDGPPYLLAFVACAPIAGLGYLMGWMKSVNEPDEPDEPENPPSPTGFGEAGTRTREPATPASP